MSEECRADGAGVCGELLPAAGEGLTLPVEVSGKAAMFRGEPATSQSDAETGKVVGDGVPVDAVALGDLVHGGAVDVVPHERLDGGVREPLGERRDAERGAPDRSATAFVLVGRAATQSVRFE